MCMAYYDSYRVLAGRVRMHVVDWPGEGPPVLFLHHITANGLASLTLGKLVNHRRRLIAPDLRGRGRTDMPFGEYNIQVHVRDVMACLDRLEVEHFIASGHSYGAMISLILAAQFSERVGGLILFDGGAMPSAIALQTLNAYYDNLTYHYASLESYIERFRNAPAYQPWTEELETLLRSNLYEQPDGTYIRRVPRYVVETERKSENLVFWQQLPELHRQVRCPVLIVRAEMGMVGPQDQVLPDDVVASMLEGMPSAQVVTVEGAGHTSLLTIPSQERDAALLQFLGLEP